MNIKKSNFRNLIIIFLLVCIFIFLSATLPAKAPKIPETVQNITEFESYLLQLTRKGPVPGISMVVVKNDSIVYNKGFGWADEPKHMSASTKTVYHWFSVTKIITAVAILQLAEQNKLQLNDAVVKYLPFFKVKYPSDSSKPITIINLLNHSSGLPDPGLHMFRWVHYDENSAINQTELVKKVIPELSKLEFEPGTDTKYTNFGYMVLGAIIEKVTGQNYEDYIRQNILKPLAMNHTDFVYTKDMEPFEAAGTHPVFDPMTLAIPYVKGRIIREVSKKYFWLNRFYNDQTPPTALIGSAEDAARFVIAYLNNGELDSTHILTQQSVKKMTCDNYMKKASYKYSYYVRQGLGWQIYKDKHGLMLQHSGGGLGFSTIIQLYPEEKLGFILFSNDTYCKGWKIVKLASDLD